MKLGQWRNRRRKFTVGTNACGACSIDRNHENCRPRYDYSLCTCTCPQAGRIRGQYLFLAEQRGVTGIDKDLLFEAVIELCPNYERDAKNNI